MNEPDIENWVEATLRKILPKSLDVKIIEDLGGHDAQPEFIVRIGSMVLHLLWIRNAWLSTIERVMARSDRPDVLIAQRVPPASRQRLAQEGIGWVETSGAAEVAIDSLVVSRSAHARRREYPVGGRWSPATVGVAEAILLGVEPTVSATHIATTLSVGACTNALRLLTDIGLLQANAERGPRSGRRVADRAAMLDAYIEAALALRSTPSVSLGVVWQDPVKGMIDIGREWDTAGLQWAATGLLAAMAVAPLVTSVGTYDAYIKASSINELEAAAESVGLRPIEGGRLKLASFPTVTTRTMSTITDGLRVAPWPRLVVDLRVSGVRGEEAAEHLLSEVSDA